MSPDTVVERRKSNAALLRFAMVLGASLLLALAAPDALFATALSSFLGIGALVTAATAAVGREPVWRPHFTRWDVAAWLHGLSVFSAFFVDQAAVGDLLRQAAVSAS